MDAGSGQVRRMGLTQGARAEEETGPGQVEGKRMGQKGSGLGEMGRRVCAHWSLGSIPDSPFRV